MTVTPEEHDFISEVSKVTVGDVEVLRIVTDKQCPVVRKNEGSALDLHAGPNCMHCEGTGFVVKYVDHAAVTRLQAEAERWQSVAKDFAERRDELKREVDMRDGQRDALKAEVERLKRWQEEVRNGSELLRQRDALQSELTKARELLNTPHTDDWFEGVRLEAGHQIGRWGTDHDAGKAPADWFWLIGYLAQKAMTAQMSGDEEKARHHTISTGAAMLNWFRAIVGDSNAMRPGIDAHQSAPAAKGGE